MRLLHFVVMKRVLVVAPLEPKIWKTLDMPPKNVMPTGKSKQEDTEWKLLKAGKFTLEALSI